MDMNRFFNFSLPKYLVCKTRIITLSGPGLCKALLPLASSSLLALPVARRSQGQRRKEGPNPFWLSPVISFGVPVSFLFPSAWPWPCCLTVALLLDPGSNHSFLQQHLNTAWKRHSPDATDPASSQPPPQGHLHQGVTAGLKAQNPSLLGLLQGDQRPQHQLRMTPPPRTVCQPHNAVIQASVLIIQTQCEWWQLLSKVSTLNVSVFSVGFLSCLGNNVLYLVNNPLNHFFLLLK